jgi:hypothetical protein
MPGPTGTGPEQQAESGPYGAATCSCQGCTMLAAQCGADLELLAHYRRRLLRRGWSGATTTAEKVFTSAHSTWRSRLSNAGTQTIARTGGISARTRASAGRNGKGHAGGRSADKAAANPHGLRPNSSPGELTVQEATP